MFYREYRHARWVSLAVAAGVALTAAWQTLPQKHRAFPHGITYVDPQDKDADADTRADFPGKQIAKTELVLPRDYEVETIDITDIVNGKRKLSTPVCSITYYCPPPEPKTAVAVPAAQKLTQEARLEQIEEALITGRFLAWLDRQPDKDAAASDVRKFTSILIENEDAPNLFKFHMEVRHAGKAYANRLNRFTLPAMVGEIRSTDPRRTPALRGKWRHEFLELQPQYEGNVTALANLRLFINALPVAVAQRPKTYAQYSDRRDWKAEFLRP